MELPAKEVLLFAGVLVLTVKELLLAIISKIGKKESNEIIACDPKNFVDVTKAINLVMKNRDDEVLNKLSSIMTKIVELHDWHSRDDPMTGVKVWYTHSTLEELHKVQGLLKKSNEELKELKELMK